MATPNIVPRSDSEGGLGTAAKYWASAYIDLIYVGAGKVGRDADNLVDFSTDDKIQFRVGGSVRSQMMSTAFFPNTNDGLALGSGGYSWSDLFLASGAVINFNNGNTTLTHSSGKLALAGALTATGGIQSGATALTATDAGVAIPAGTAVASINADGDANHIVILPAPVVGNIINIIETATTGYELRSSNPEEIGINGGTADGAESAIAGAITYIKCVCVSDSSWICSQYDADGDESKVAAAAA
jgi:hypothetical protein